MQHLNIPIGSNRFELNKTNRLPIGSTKQQVIDELLESCETLIDPKYHRWFGGAFQKLQPNIIMKLAAEAKQDGKNPARLFCYLVKKELARMQ